MGCCVSRLKDNDGKSYERDGGVSEQDALEILKKYAKKNYSSGTRDELDQCFGSGDRYHFTYFIFRKKFGLDEDDCEAILVNDDDNLEPTEPEDKIYGK